VPSFPFTTAKALPDLRCRLGSRVPSAGQLAGYAGMRLRKHNAKAAVSSKSRTAGTRVSGVCVGRLEQCSRYASLCAARERAAECWRCEDVAVMFLKTATKIDLSRRPHVQRHCCKNRCRIPSEVYWVLSWQKAPMGGKTCNRLRGENMAVASSESA